MILDRIKEIGFGWNSRKGWIAHCWTEGGSEYVIAIQAHWDASTQELLDDLFWRLDEMGFECAESLTVSVESP